MDNLDKVLENCFEANNQAAGIFPVVCYNLLSGRVFFVCKSKTLQDAIDCGRSYENGGNAICIFYKGEVIFSSAISETLNGQMPTQCFHELAKFVKRVKDSFAYKENCRYFA